MLLEADLLRLGKVLLLAQETANNSIERALRRRRIERAGGEASPADGCTENSATHGALPVGKQYGRACGNACAGSRSAKPGVGERTKPTTTTTENPSENISRERSETCQGRRLGRDPRVASSSFEFPRQRQQESLNLNCTGAVPDTDAAAAAAASASLASQDTPCLWCNPGSAAGRQRWHRVAALAKIKDRHRHGIVRQAVACQHQGTTTARARQPRRFGNASSQPPPPAMHQRPPRRRRRSESEPIQSAPISPSKRPSDVAAVEIDEQGHLRPLDGSWQDPISFGADGLSTAQRQQEQIDHLSWHNPAPGAFFCSWECAGRWNAKFSPVQARQERGLRIDIAAGRLIGR